ncbi:MAG: hypothetical protein F2796_02220 [Actinobacteria bacterium]|nr:hypothetical protein [Actinomycetota bacterium]
MLGTAATAPAAAASVALRLARRRGGAALILTLGCADAGRQARVLAAPSAARLAAELAQQGQVAAACGRLVRIALPTDEPLPAALWLSTAAGEAPCVVACCGPRSEQGEVLLQHAGVVHLVGSEDDPICRLALDGLRRDGRNADLLRPPSGAVTALALLGVGP